MSDTYTALATSVNYGSPDHDIQFDVDLNLITVSDAEAVAQRVRQHLETYAGEWFLNTDVGVGWFEFVYVTPFDQGVAESVIKEAILNVPGVEEIIEFVVSVDRNARRFSLDRVSVRTEFDSEVRV